MFKLYKNKNFIRSFHLTKGSNIRNIYKKHEYCKYCKGYTSNQCLECRGSGKILRNGMKEYLCNNCRGRGEIVCIFCGGCGQCNSIF